VEPSAGPRLPAGRVLAPRDLNRVFIGFALGSGRLPNFPGADEDPPGGGTRRERRWEGREGEGRTSLPGGSGPPARRRRRFRLEILFRTYSDDSLAARGLGIILVAGPISYWPKSIHEFYCNVHLAKWLFVTVDDPVAEDRGHNSDGDPGASVGRPVPVDHRELT